MRKGRVRTQTSFFCSAHHWNGFGIYALLIPSKPWGFPNARAVGNKGRLVRRRDGTEGEGNRVVDCRQGNDFFCLVAFFLFV